LTRSLDILFGELTQLLGNLKGLISHPPEQAPR